jgi:hypothetical protein
MWGVGCVYVFVGVYVWVCLCGCVGGGGRSVCVLVCLFTPNLHICYAMQCYVSLTSMLCFTIPYHTKQYYTIPYHTILSPKCIQVKFKRALINTQESGRRRHTVQLLLEDSVKHQEQSRLRAMAMHGEEEEESPEVGAVLCWCVVLCGVVVCCCAVLCCVVWWWCVVRWWCGVLWCVVVCGVCCCGMLCVWCAVLCCAVLCCAIIIC